MEFGNLGHLKPLGGKNWWHLQGVQGGWGPLQSRSLCAAELSSAADTDSPSFFSLFLAASVSAPSCVMKLKRHLCGVPPGRSQVSLPCPVRGSLSSWGLLSPWGPRLLGYGRCRPGEAFFLPSVLSLQCFVFCSGFLCGLQGSPRAVFVHGSLSTYWSFLQGQMLGSPTWPSCWCYSVDLKCIFLFF